MSSFFMQLFSKIYIYIYMCDKKCLLRETLFCHTKYSQLHCSLRFLICVAQMVLVLWKQALLTLENKFLPTRKIIPHVHNISRVLCETFNFSPLLISAKLRVYVSSAPFFDFQETLGDTECKISCRKICNWNKRPFVDDYFAEGTICARAKTWRMYFSSSKL